MVVFGGSGTGKTILLRLIAGVEEPTAGSILIGGHDVSDIAPEHRGVGMAFQNFALFPHMSASENIATPLRAAACRETGRARPASPRWRSSCKIDHVLGHAPRELSNGQKQRTALARALAAEPAHPAARRSAAQRRRQAPLRDAARAAAPAAPERRDGPLRDAGLQGGHGAGRPHRGAAPTATSCRSATPEDIYVKPATLSVARLFGDPSINTAETVVEGGRQGRRPVARRYARSPSPRHTRDLPARAVDLRCPAGSHRDQVEQEQRHPGRGRGGDAAQ